MVNGKIISLPIRYKSYCRLKSFNSYDYKLDNSISRAKSKVLDYVMNNNFKYFVTLTFNNNLDSYNLAQISNFISQRIRDIRKKYKIDLKYIFIPEKHKKGDWHLHGFVTEDIDVCLYVNKHGYKSCYDFDFCGWQNFSKINNYERCAMYVTKYITKDLATLGKGKHLYFCSKGLAKSQKLYDIVTAGYSPQFDFESDYCNIKFGIDDIEIQNIFNHYYNIYN